MDNLVAFLTKVMGWEQQFGFAAAGVAFGIAFILMLFGPKMSEKAKMHIFWIICGIAGLVLITTLISTVRAGAGG